MSQEEKDFEVLLEHLKRNRGFDFTGYKRPSLARRVEKRMHSVGVTGFAEYQDYLEVHPEEFVALFNTILINVTAFFRDEAAWSYLSETVIPELLKTRGSSASIRAWSAGCASGEEAYTLAMVLAEAVGFDGFRDRVKIYATDVDDDALARARSGLYSEQDVAAVPDRLRTKYFEIADGQFAFRKELRRQIIFGRHDLVNDAPISHVDLLVCRNTLMYLNAETQSKIIARLHFALNPGGILFLGRAETLLAYTSTFEPIDLKRRISRKVARDDVGLRERMMLLGQIGGEELVGQPGTHARLREIAYETGPIAQLIMDGNGLLLQVNERARSMFGIGAGEIGRPLQDLRVSYRPIELRSLMERSRAEHRSLVVQEVEWQQVPGEVRFLDVQITALTDGGVFVGSSVAFLDVTTTVRLRRDLELARKELETAYEELQSTNEELETTNEELQSTVEELETTNEELQTTNEELQTMNEEIQSTNEELTTMNDEMRDRGEELERLNLFLESVMASIDSAVVVVDKDLHILAWSRKAHEFWGLREGEVTGKHLLGLDIGLPVGELRLPLKRVMTDGTNEPEVVELQTTNRRGRAMPCRISLSALRDIGGTTRGAILLMEEAETAPSA